MRKLGLGGTHPLTRRYTNSVTLTPEHLDTRNVTHYIVQQKLISIAEPETGGSS